jgi:hypothetical protein
MNDIKSVVSVIKILERTIGILENCNDVGKIPDSTRKRVIEMLNKATLEIYFLDDDPLSEQPIKSDIAKEQVIESPTIPNVVEETYEPRSAVETVTEESVKENVLEDETIDFVPEDETLDFVPEDETFAEEEFYEEESVPENVFDENTITEDSIFTQQDLRSDSPLFEWAINEPESVRQTPETNKEDELNLLKLQLEEERKRLEQELQNWQDEKRKRDEEIFATKKLLENLQQQAAVNQAKQQSAPQQSQPAPRQSQPAPQQSQPAPRQSQPAPQQSQPAPQTSRRVQQPQQPAKTEPLPRELTKKDETQGALIDRFIGTKKVLHENFESDNMVNQISTPVSSLPKAIGINDRFRFIKELFGGDSDLYNDTIKKLDTIGSLVSAISYIESNFSWDKNSDSVKQLISLIRRRYM